MLKGWWWLCLLGEPSLLAELLGGELALRTLHSWEARVAQLLPQKLSLILLESNAWDTHKSQKGKTPVFLPLLCLVGKASAHGRMVNFLHNLGNERQSSGSVSSFMWWKIRCTREPYLRASTERERPTNTWIRWERLKSPTPQRKQSIADHKSLGRKKKRSRKYPLWVERRKEEMTK